MRKQVLLYGCVIIIIIRSNIAHSHSISIVFIANTVLFDTGVIRHAETDILLVTRDSLHGSARPGSQRVAY